MPHEITNTQWSHANNSCSKTYQGDLKWYCVFNMVLFHVWYFQRYLKRFEFANANTQDLWQVLREVSTLAWSVSRINFKYRFLAKTEDAWHLCRGGPRIIAAKELVLNQNKTNNGQTCALLVGVKNKLSTRKFAPWPCVKKEHKITMRSVSLLWSLE